MRKKLGMNKQQKAVYRVGERRVGREDIPELLEMSCSLDPEQRLEAAEWLCPCHVRRRIDEVWDALFRLLEDLDDRVRQAAWHTLEDGGKPSEPKAIQFLKDVMHREQDPKIRRFAHHTFDKLFGNQQQIETAKLRLAHREHRVRDKCDFCGESNVFVELELQTLIPTAELPRAARICEKCARADTH